MRIETSLLLLSIPGSIGSTISAYGPRYSTRIPLSADSCASSTIQSLRQLWSSFFRSNLYTSTPSKLHSSGSSSIRPHAIVESANRDGQTILAWSTPILPLLWSITRSPCMIVENRSAPGKTPGNPFILKCVTLE